LAMFIFFFFFKKNILTNNSKFKTLLKTTSTFMPDQNHKKKCRSKYINNHPPLIKVPKM